MPAKTIHATSSDRTPSVRTNVRLPDSFRFMSPCPTCNEARFQHGYDFRALVTLLVSNLPIDAYCPVCNECWPITAGERAELAWLLLTD